MEQNVQSAQIDELIAALATAQGQIKGAKKDSVNPFFKSHYADLNSCWEALEPLSENGLAVIQTTSPVGAKEIIYYFDNKKTGAFDERKGIVEVVSVVTTLGHKSGQWIRGTLNMVPEKPGPQACGIALSYARRYALSAITGLSQADDDAEGATNRDNGKKQTKKYDDKSPQEESKPAETPTTPASGVKVITDKQVKFFWAKMKEFGVTKEGVDHYLAKIGLGSVAEIPMAEFANVRNALEGISKGETADTIPY